tara:strand:- start:1757 stop:3046 length:1290 start_codon:yes stop_codon:yes gene_type:complete
MKTRNLKAELRLKQKLITRGEGIPANREGRDGDFTIRHVPGRGLFFFYKWGENWYGSRMSLYTSKRSERQEPVYLPVGRKPSKAGEISLDKDNKTKIYKGKKVEHLISIDKDNNADLKTPAFFKRDDKVSMTDDESKDPTFLIENTGHAHMRFFTHKDADTGTDKWDQFSSFGTVHPETFSTVAWVLGLDTSENKFKLMQKTGSGGGGAGIAGKLSDLTPSSADSAIRLAITSGGWLQVGTIPSGVSGNKILVTDNTTRGYIKHRTPDELRADISANKHYLTKEVSSRLTNSNWHAGGTDLGTTGSLSASDWDLGSGYGIAEKAIFVPTTNSTINNIRWVGAVDSTASYSAELWDVVINNGNAAASTAARIGSAYNLGSVTASTWKQILNVSDINHVINAGDALFLVFRYTSGVGTKNIKGSLTVEFTI